MAELVHCFQINLESFSPEKQFRVKDRDQKFDQTAEDYEFALELENDISTLGDEDSDYQMVCSLLFVNRCIIIFNIAVMLTLSRICSNKDKQLGMSRYT